ncbi:hypothetical protein HMPREF0645_2194 [Hallella bergensis DSM 17361]|uniref:Uncharacterized protein n=1 Tax=Hallella bergensis DSM 17361 TaxID=585502 RepID=D1PZ09_9BACT|nr:hypothetical protein HMPREF0645_2194 [Hallella bergensis DSM 17361]
MLAFITKQKANSHQKGKKRTTIRNGFTPDINPPRVKPFFVSIPLGA